MSSVTGNSLRCYSQYFFRSLGELALDEPAQLLPEQWLERIVDLSEKIKRLDRQIERVAASPHETQLLMSVPGISSFSGLIVHIEIGEVD